MNQTQAPFLHDEKSPTATVVAGVTAITAAYIYFLIFAGFAFIELAQAVVKGGHMQIVLGALGAGGIGGCVWSVRRFTAERGRRQLTAGFAGCALAAMLTLVAKSEFVMIVTALLVGLSTAWTAVSLSLCLRPTLHFKRLGMWCGLGTGLAYALCNQPFVFEAALRGKVITAAVVAVIGLVASLGMRSAPQRPSSLPDYERQAAIGWIVALFALVFLDTLVFFIIQNSAALKQLSWETPLILQGNAFVHLCAAFVAGMVMDQRWPGLSALAALFLLVASSIVLGLSIEHFPKARMLYVAGVSIYSTVLIYLPARGGRPLFTATLFAVSGWLSSGLALSFGIGLHARNVSPYVIAAALGIGLAGLFTRFLWIKRAQELEAERLVQRKPA